MTVERGVRPTAAAVRDIGVETLDRLNRGAIDLLERDKTIEGLQAVLAGVASRSSGGVNIGDINYHGIESAPTARDLVRGIDDELLIRTGRLRPPVSIR